MLLDSYLEVRREVHLLYEIGRAASDDHSATQFAVQKGRLKDATWSSEEQRALEKVTRNLEKRNMLALWMACRKGLVKAVKIALKEDRVDVNQAQETGSARALDGVPEVSSGCGARAVKDDKSDGCQPGYGILGARHLS